MAMMVVKPAFKYEYGPGSWKKVEPVGMPSNRSLVSVTIGAIVLAHILVLMLNPDLFYSSREFEPEEEATTVDLDFSSDLSLKAPTETALPNAKKSEDTAVPLNLLPQLPKKFEVEEQKKIEEKVVAEEEDPKAEEALANKVVEMTPKDATPAKTDELNKVNQDDLRRRLALEKLKKENKVDQQLKAQKNAIARLKEDHSRDNADSNSGVSGTVGNALSTGYQSLLRAAVKRNFYLAKSFEYETAKPETVLAVIINVKGELESLRLYQSSGNEAYDQAVIAAMQNSVPLPKPTAEYVGREIKFKF